MPIWITRLKAGARRWLAREQRAQIGGDAAFGLAAFHGEVHLRAVAIADDVLESRAQELVEDRHEHHLAAARAGCGERCLALLGVLERLLTDERRVTGTGSRRSCCRSS